MKPARHGRTAIWAITPNGAVLARRIAERLDGSVLFLSQKLTDGFAEANRFSRLKPAVAGQFPRFSGHVFIMATGIVVRTIAGLLAHKTMDPAVVVCDDAGRFAVSLVSGHVGGANALAATVGRITGGQAVITTATDVNHVPAIDLIAVDNDLVIENPDAIKTVNMALLTGGQLAVHDPYGKLAGHLPEQQVHQCTPDQFGRFQAGVYVDHIHLDLPPHVLVLRPGSLVAGMGCNRGTDVAEMHTLLAATFDRHHLSPVSLRALATVDLKADEKGLLTLAESLDIPVVTFTRDRLKSVEQIPTPSIVVEKHIGVQSVCEAAALLATNRGRLIVPKQKTANVTLAVAADAYTSSVSAPATRST